MAGPEIERLVGLLARLPGLGPRSARRATLHLLRRKEQLMLPLVAALEETAERITPCRTICCDPRRDAGLVCVVEGVADLWALERSGSFRGRYHVLGGTLSALDGVAPTDLNIEGLVRRVGEGGVREVILATNATVEGQTTAHYVTDRLAASNVPVTRLAHGVPVGGELDYLDDGTIGAALRARKPV
jgi:recombination protein RecR